MELTMRFRARFFAVLALISIIVPFIGFFIGQQGISNVKLTPVATSEYLTLEEAENARAVGSAIGVTLVGTAWMSVCLCPGLALALLFSLLAWRNQAGLTNERRHQEQLAVAQMQFHTMQQQVVQNQPAGGAAVNTPTIGDLTPMSAEQRRLIDRAMALLQENKRAEARKLLQAIGHPKAMELIVKIDSGLM
jgi:hypothetical protein